MIHRSNSAALIPDLLPVPRKCARHDSWTPERQRAFIEALDERGAGPRPSPGNSGRQA